MKRTILLTILLVLTACAPQTAIPPGTVELTMTASALPPTRTETLAPPSLTPVPPTPTALPTDTPVFIPTDSPIVIPTDLPTDTPTPTLDAASTTCAGWNWNRQPLPDISAAFLEKLQAAGLPVETARAEAYGEDCLSNTGSVLRFATMQTDFYLTLTVIDLSDETALGGLLDQAITVLDQFPNDQTPGPQPGYVGLTFKAGEQVQNLWFQQTRLAELRAQGLSGADLYRTLKN
jgi:hypothetical protein